MQIAPQLGQATGFAGQSGTGSLQTAGQMAGVGQAYQNMATDPAEMQKYMNPYIQQALNPQLQLLNQQQALQGQGIAAKASGQGAFGGNRATLAQGLNAQNYALAGQQAIGQGYNDAFKQAQQAQQFGANLGLQGLQGALAGYGQANQAAATLGQLGQTQYGQQMGINQAQMQSGAMQQALQQQGLDVNYQDFLKERNYPYQQLAFQSDMMRGLPLSQSAQTMYAAPPSTASQLGGLGMTGLGIYGMSGGFKGAAGGGLMDAKTYKEGGMVGYAGGGKLSTMSDEQLQEMLGNPSTDPMVAMEIEKLLALHRRMEMNPQTAQIMGGGLDTAPSGDMFEAAGGGIVAFAGTTDGSLVKTSERSSSPKPIRPEIKDYQGWLESQIRSSIENQDKVNPFAKSEEMQAQYAEDMKARKEQRPYELLTALGIGTAAGNSQYGLSNLGQGGVYALQQQQKLAAEDASDRKLMLQQAVEQEKSKYARDTGKVGSMQTALGQMYSREIGLKNANASAASTAAYRDQLLAQKYATLWKDTLDDTKNSLLKQTKFNTIYMKDPVKFNRLAEQEAKRSMPPAALEILGKTPALMDTDVSSETSVPTGKAPALPKGFVIQ
jgi:hypothetical protein